MPTFFLRAALLSLVMVVIAAFGSHWAIAQTSPSQAQRVVLESWTFKDGAPEGVQALAQTADGYLWLGTQFGLFRFDGRHFEAFRAGFGDQLMSNSVSALLADSTGGLWVGYLFGGFSFLKNGKITNFVESVAPTQTILGFAQDRKGIVWCATGAGLWRFDGSAWLPITGEWNAPAGIVYQVGFDKDGILWVLSGWSDVGRELFYLLPNNRRFQRAGDHLAAKLSWDADHTVLTTHEHGPSEPGSGINLDDSLPAYPILRKDSGQFLDRADGIWIMPLAYPFLMRHRAGKPLGEALREASPGNSEAYKLNPNHFAFLVDREGGVWFGDSRGIHRFSYTPLMNQEFPKEAPTFALAADEGGAVWVVAGDYNSTTLYRVADGKATEKSQQNLQNLAYRAPDRSLWFGGKGGLWRVVNGVLNRIELPPEVAHHAIGPRAITQDRSGGMWVAWGAILYRYADGVWTLNGGRDDFPKQLIMVEFTDSVGRVWFGSSRSRLTVLDGGRLLTFGPSDGIRVGNITAIHGRGSEIWIGGEFGLQQFDHGRFHTIQTVDKEPLRGISGIVETANGDLWLNTLAGILHVRRTEILEALRNPGHEVSGERFGRGEGLPGLPLQIWPIPTASEGTDGRLWFTVNNGVVWLDPTRASNRTPPPPVSIQSVAADDKAYELDQSRRFPAGTSNVQISYAAVSLLNPEAIRFRYRLQEIDDEWRDAARSTSVNFRNLTPGSYHFQVEASDPNGAWSDRIATTDFTILPAYYQTAWFRALFALLLLLLGWAGYQLYRARMRDINERKLAEEAVRGKDQALQMASAELARVSRVTTLGALTASIAHEVNQPLGAMVANAAAGARWLAAQPPEVGKARHVLESISADGKRAGEIIARIRALTKRQPPSGAPLDVNREIFEVLALADDALRAHEIALETQLERDLPPARGDRIQLQQVLLNLIMNAIDAMNAIHDRPRALTIVSRRDGTDGVAVEVRDSGTGLDPEAAERVFEAFYTTKPDGMGIGLSISRSIVEAHGGQMSVSANAPYGAVFRFTLPQAEEESS